jgi:gas vesicle protein
MHHHGHQDNQAASKFSIGLIGLGLGALLGLAFSPHSGRRNRTIARNWMHRMNDELQDRLDETRDLTQSKYNEIVDELNRKYGKARDIKDRELEEFTRDLKSRWERIKDRWQNDDRRDGDYF